MLTLFEWIYIIKLNDTVIGVKMFNTEIKVRQANKKIKYTKLRIKMLSVWDAPEELKKLKDHCISALKDQIVFLNGHRNEHFP